MLVIYKNLIGFGIANMTMDGIACMVSGHASLNILNSH